VTGREPFVTLDGLRMAKQCMFFSSAKAERELGFKARPAIDALVDAIAWFRARGMIR
jgi:dihydroflavonol-4-reductase